GRGHDGRAHDDAVDAGSRALLGGTGETKAPARRSGHGCGSAGAGRCPRGMTTASPRPITAAPVSTPSAAAYGWPFGTAAATRIEPASAVPSDEPRLATLRDSPEMS